MRWLALLGLLQIAAAQACPEYDATVIRMDGASAKVLRGTVISMQTEPMVTFNLTQAFYAPPPCEDFCLNFVLTQFSIPHEAVLRGPDIVERYCTMLIEFDGNPIFSDRFE